MKLDGDLASNLKFAIQSATKLRRHPVHPDTLKFWRELLSLARKEGRNAGPTHYATLEGLIGKLEDEIAKRGDRNVRPNSH